MEGKRGPRYCRYGREHGLPKGEWLASLFRIPQDLDWVSWGARDRCSTSTNLPSGEFDSGRSDANCKTDFIHLGIIAPW